MNGKSGKKLALVFGGSRGIGAACVEALKEEFQVSFTSTANVDIQKPEDVKRAFDELEKRHGRKVDCVVANAGINVPPGPMAQFDPADFRKLVEVNIVGAFNVLAEAARQVADGGTIIAITTSLVRHAAPGLGPYSATKAAVECMVRSMAKELAARKVRVNAVAPGPVDTDLFRAGKTDEAIQRSAAMSPFNRVGTPKEIGEVVAFLASDKASWVHGQVVQPNGGLV
jgi:3-oxoacyl-[acyl-carrier protein] reductase